MIYLIPIIFTVAFAFYTKYQLVDVKMEKGSLRRWHPFGFVMRAAVFVLPLYYAWTETHPTILDVLLSASINIVLFEVLINVIALHKSVFYVGGTAGLDKAFGKAKWFVYFGLLLISAIARMLTPKKYKRDLHK